jgi:phosphomannomutase
MISRHDFHPNILREYDVRGTMGISLSDDDAYALGRSLASATKDKGGSRIAIGRDGRLSSPALADAALAGVRDGGLVALDVGLGPTPMLYYAVHHLKADSGLMITGSHNPPQDNGFKMAWADGPLYGAAITDLGKRAAEGSWSQGVGSIHQHPEVMAAYVARVLQDAPKKAVNAGWDPGNGAAGAVIDAIVGALPGRHIIINGTVDGTFPAHHPDPTVDANLLQLRALVAAEKFDIGLAFDGDGDRLGTLDARGRIVRADQYMTVLARDVLARNPGASIVGDVKCSKVMFDEIRRAGGNAVMWKTGHSLIKAKMKELHAALAGEMSGHIFYADGYYGFDDGLYAALRLLSALENLGVTLAEAHDALPVTFATPELRIECDESQKFGVISQLISKLKAEGATVSDIDGARVDTADGWWLLRASNTQAVLVGRCESTSAEGLERLMDTLAGHLRPAGLEMPQEGAGH